MRYRKNQIVKMNKSALENYGHDFEDVLFIVTHCSNKYMPAEEFYRKGRPEGYHPGYDESASPMGLYDLKFLSDGKDLEFSLYDWELKALLN